MDLWKECQRVIYEDIRELTKEIKLLNEKITVLTVDVARLQIKTNIWASLFGLMGGAIATLMALALQLFRK